MQIEIPQQLEQRTLLHGTVNGETFKMRGGGMGRPHHGEVATNLRTNPGPVGFKTGLMAPCIIMGYPTFSRYEEGAQDLFKISDGYRYERHLTFPGGGRLDTTNKVDYVGDRSNGKLKVGHLEGDFEVHGNVIAPELVSVEPVEEHFHPAGKGKIESHFKIVWRTADGGTFEADVKNVYHLNHDRELPAMHKRRIEFDAEYTPETIRQSETLVVRLA
jgi:hypothetical protein